MNEALVDLLDRVTAGGDARALGPLVRSIGHELGTQVEASRVLPFLAVLASAMELPDTSLGAVNCTLSTLVDLLNGYVTECVEQRRRMALRDIIVSSLAVGPMSIDTLTETCNLERPTVEELLSDLIRDDTVVRVSEGHSYYLSLTLPAQGSLAYAWVFWNKPAETGESFAAEFWDGRHTDQ